MVVCHARVHILQSKVVTTASALLTALFRNGSRQESAQNSVAVARSGNNAKLKYTASMEDQVAPATYREMCLATPSLVLWTALFLHG